MTGKKRRAVFCCAWILTLALLLASCGKTPAPAPAPDPVQPDGPEPQTQAETVVRIPFAHAEGNGNKGGSMEIPYYRTYGYVDEHGYWATAGEYNKAMPFTEYGTAVVGIFDPEDPDVNDELEWNDSYLWGIIDTDGNYLLEPKKYDVFWQCDNGMILFRNGEKDMMGVMDAFGNVVLEPSYPDIRPYINGYAVFFEESGDYGLLDETGSVALMTPGYIVVNSVSDDALIISDGMLYGLMRLNGEVVVEPQYGLIAYTEGDKVFMAFDTTTMTWGLMSLDGHWVTEPKYDSMSRGTGSPARWTVQRSSKFGYLNENGDEVVAVRYANASDFCDGYAAVCLDGFRWGIIDADGNTVIPLKNEAADTRTICGLMRIAPSYGETAWVSADGVRVVLDGTEDMRIRLDDLNLTESGMCERSEVMIYYSPEGLRMTDAQGRQRLEQAVSVPASTWSDEWDMRSMIGAVICKYEEARRVTVFTRTGETYLLDYDGNVLRHEKKG